MLYEANMPLKQLMMLKVGDTLPLNVRPDALVTVRCGDVPLSEGRMGRVGDRVAIRVTSRCANRIRPTRCSRNKTSKPN